jgi:hypothetical protein
MELIKIDSKYEWLAKSTYPNPGTIKMTITCLHPSAKK